MRKRLLKRQNDRPKNDDASSKFEPLKNLKIAYIPYNELFKEGIIAGIGWAFGVTIGFVIISTILAIVLSLLGGLPLIGGWIASIVEATQEQLLRRTPLFHQ